MKTTPVSTADYQPPLKAQAWTWPRRVHIRERSVCEWLTSVSNEQLVKKVWSQTCRKKIACHSLEFLGDPLPMLHFQTDAGVKKPPGLSNVFVQPPTHHYKQPSSPDGLLCSAMLLCAFAASLVAEEYSNHTNVEAKNPSSPNCSPRHPVASPAATAPASLLEGLAWTWPFRPMLPKTWR